MQDDVKELCERLTSEIVFQRDACGYTSQVRNPDGKEAAAAIIRELIALVEAIGSIAGEG